METEQRLRSSFNTLGPLVFAIRDTPFFRAIKVSLFQFFLCIKYQKYSKSHPLFLKAHNKSPVINEGGH